MEHMTREAREAFFVELTAACFPEWERKYIHEDLTTHVLIMLGIVAVEKTVAKTEWSKDAIELLAATVEEMQQQMNHEG